VCVPITCPITGTSLRTGMDTALRPWTLSEAPLEPQKTCDMYAVKPMARMLMATPLTIWFPTNLTTRTAWSRPSRPPTSTAARTPSQGFPVKKLTATPEKAPVSIMPSRPMLTTPALSEKIPPREVSAMGVAIRSDAAKSPMLITSMSSTMLTPLEKGSNEHWRRDEEDHEGLKHHHYV